MDSPLLGASGGLTAWLRRMPAARAAYDVATAAVRGFVFSEAARERATQAPADVWQRVLDLEGCAAWLDRARQRSPTLTATLGSATALVRSEGARALRNAVAMVQQLAELVPVAAAIGARVLVLKGSARLLAGESAGGRTMADIDLLVADDGGGGGADALHAALQSELGYQPDEPGTPARHLPSLMRADSLPIEIHGRLTDAGSALDGIIWEGPRSVPLGAGTIEIPSATAVLLHTLEHAVVVHRAGRYRLRDVLDVAAAWTEEVDAVAVGRFADGHPERRAARTLLRAASRTAVSGSVSRPVDGRAERQAWQRIRRVGRARLLAPPQPGVPAGSDPRVLVLSQLAEGAPGPVWRLIAHGAAAPRRAVQLVAGEWLPVEADRAQAAARGASAAPRSGGGARP